MSGDTCIVCGECFPCECDERHWERNKGEALERKYKEQVKELEYKLNCALKEVRRAHHDKLAAYVKCECVFCTGITPCSDCGGSGIPEGCPEGSKPECPYCEGTGKVKW